MNEMIERQTKQQISKCEEKKESEKKVNTKSVTKRVQNCVGRHICDL